MKTRNIPHRPGPSHGLFFMVKNAVHLWKSVNKSFDRDKQVGNRIISYWDIEQLSAPQNKKKRVLLLQTISTWFDRRSRKLSRNKCINPKLLQEWIIKIQTKPDIKTHL